MLIGINMKSGQFAKWWKYQVSPAVAQNVKLAEDLRLLTSQYSWRARSGINVKINY